jgi:hypothetical protein
MSIVSVPSGTVRPVAGKFRVLALHAFEHGVVRGVDSPIYMPRSFDFSVQELIEDEITPA